MDFGFNHPQWPPGYHGGNVHGHQGHSSHIGYDYSGLGHNFSWTSEDYNHGYPAQWPDLTISNSSYPQGFPYTSEAWPTAHPSSQASDTSHDRPSHDVASDRSKPKPKPFDWKSWQQRKNGSKRSSHLTKSPSRHPMLSPRSKESQPSHANRGTANGTANGKHASQSLAQHPSSHASATSGVVPAAQPDLDETPPLSPLSESDPAQKDTLSRASLCTPQAGEVQKSCSSGQQGHVTPEHAVSSGVWNVVAQKRPHSVVTSSDLTAGSTLPSKRRCTSSSLTTDTEIGARNSEDMELGTESEDNREKADVEEVVIIEKPRVEPALIVLSDGEDDVDDKFVAGNQAWTVEMINDKVRCVEHHQHCYHCSCVGVSDYVSGICNISAYGLGSVAYLSGKF